MSKLQRVIDGQTIQFTPVPRIFNSLAADLPSGAVKLPNGEVAHWRLTRNLAELKKQRKNMKDIALKLAKAFKTLVDSDTFLNHYGLTKAPEIAPENQLTSLFMRLLQLNTNRVEYATIHHSRNKTLVESVVLALGNLVYLNAYRGLNNLPNGGTIKGKLWLTETSDADQFFAFSIVSPVVNLTDYISPDRLASEIINRLKLNLPIIAHNPRVEFDDGQFENFLERGLDALAEKHAASVNGAGKKAHKAALTAPKTPNSSMSGAHAELPVAEAAAVTDDAPTFKSVDDLTTHLDEQIEQPASLAEDLGVLLEATVLDRESFEALDDKDQTEYVRGFMELAGEVVIDPQSPKVGAVKAFLNSGVLNAQWNEHNAGLDDKTKAKTQSYFLAQILSLSDDQFFTLLGAEAPRFITEGNVTDDTDDETTVAADQPGEILQEAVPSATPVAGSDYTVVSGDTLFGIAETAYGNGDLWPSIHLSNLDKIEDPNLIHPGQVIFVPVVDGTAAPETQTASVNDAQGLEEGTDAVVHARGETPSLVHIDEAAYTAAGSSQAQEAAADSNVDAAPSSDSDSGSAD